MKRTRRPTFYSNREEKGGGEEGTKESIKYNTDNSIVNSE